MSTIAVIAIIVVLAAVIGLLVLSNMGDGTGR